MHKISENLPFCGVEKGTVALIRRFRIKRIVLKFKQEMNAVLNSQLV